MMAVSEIQFIAAHKSQFAFGGRNLSDENVHRTIAKLSAHFLFLMMTNHLLGLPFAARGVCLCGL